MLNEFELKSDVLKEILRSLQAMEDEKLHSYAKSKLKPKSEVLEEMLEPTDSEDEEKIELRKPKISGKIISIKSTSPLESLTEDDSEDEDDLESDPILAKLKKLAKSKG